MGPITTITCSFYPSIPSSLVHSIIPAYLCVFWFGASVGATGQSSGNLTLANNERPPGDQSIPKANCSNWTGPNSTCSLFHPHKPAGDECPLKSIELPSISNMHPRFTITFMIVNKACNSKEGSYFHLVPNKHFHNLSSLLKKEALFHDFYDHRRWNI